MNRALASLAQAAVVLFLLLPGRTPAYDLNGVAWPNGNISFQLALGNPAGVLSDSSATWDDVALAAIAHWNAQMVRTQLVGIKQSTAAKAQGNQLNNVFFDSDSYGEAFGERVLAVTLYRYNAINLIEADIVVNTNPPRPWNSYRGNLRSGSLDLQRVLTHEFGHALGLNHPDEAEPAQQVDAVMNSVVNNFDAPQTDDIAGVKVLYGTALTAPTARGTLAGQTVAAGAPLTLNYTASGGNDLSYFWFFTPPGGTARYLLNGDGVEWADSTYQLFSAQASDAGTYAVAAANFAGLSPFTTAEVSVTPVSTADALLANLSARARAGSGDDTLIVGFVITGNTPKSVMIRAVGPGLRAQGITSPLADPRLELFRNVNSVQVAQDANDNWSADAGKATAIRAAASRLGAFALDDGSKDAVLLLTLEPGVYSAKVDAQGGTPGIALVEVYDADTSHAASLQHRLVNVATRSYAGTGDEKLFAGFVITGNAPKQVLIRAIGPGLTAYGVTGVNGDPNLELYKGSQKIADNDDWDLCNETDILPAVFSKVGAFGLDSGSYTNSALLITLPPGAYSAQASGRRGETGVVLIEVYEVPE